MTPDQLRTESEMLAARSCLERADYLSEVAHSRGPEDAEALARLAVRLEQIAGPAPALSRARGVTRQA